MKVDKYIGFKTLPKKFYLKVSEVVKAKTNVFKMGKMAIYCISITIRNGKTILFKFKTLGEYKIELTNLIKNNIPFGNDYEIDHNNLILDAF